MIERICENCGKTFKVWECIIKNGKGRFCSKSCSQTGKNNTSWKGGIRKNMNGYIYIYSPHHPYSSKDNYVAEHRLVMEKYLGRFLKPKELTHHINGITYDNRIENLELINRSLHASLHFKLYWKRRKLSLSSKIQENSLR